MIYIGVALRQASLLERATPRSRLLARALATAYLAKALLYVIGFGLSMAIPSGGPSVWAWLGAGAFALSLLVERGAAVLLVRELGVPAGADGRSDPYDVRIRRAVHILRDRPFTAPSAAT